MREQFVQSLRILAIYSVRHLSFEVDTKRFSEAGLAHSKKHGAGKRRPSGELLHGAFGIPKHHGIKSGFVFTKPSFSKMPTILLFCFVFSCCNSLGF